MEIKNLIGKNVEISVGVSEKIVLIARLIKRIEGGILFKDEVQNEEFALRNSDITGLTEL